MTALITIGQDLMRQDQMGQTSMGKKNNKCCKKFKEGNRCKSCPLKKGK